MVAFDNSAMPRWPDRACHLVGESWRELADGIADVLDLDPTARAAEVDAGRRWAGSSPGTASAPRRPPPSRSSCSGRGGVGRSAAGDERQVAVAEDQ